MLHNFHWHRDVSGSLDNLVLDTSEHLAAQGCCQLTEGFTPNYEGWGGLIPKNVSIPVGLGIQGVYEKVSPNICCPSHIFSIYLLFGEYISPVWPLCFITISFRKTEKRKVPHTMNDWNYTPATLFQLPASLCCMPGYWGCYFVEFNSQGHLPTYSQAAECRGQ